MTTKENSSEQTSQKRIGRPPLEGGSVFVGAKVPAQMAEDIPAPGKGRSKWIREAFAEKLERQHNELAASRTL